jgi:hypothetical protein
MAILEQILLLITQLELSESLSNFEIISDFFI